jgi:hypothetical protein
MPHAGGIYTYIARGSARCSGFCAADALQRRHFGLDRTLGAALPIYLGGLIPLTRPRASSSPSPPSRS